MGGSRALALVGGLGGSGSVSGERRARPSSPPSSGPMGPLWPTSAGGVRAWGVWRSRAVRRARRAGAWGVREVSSHEARDPSIISDSAWQRARVLETRVSTLEAHELSEATLAMRAMDRERDRERWRKPRAWIRGQRHHHAHARIREVCARSAPRLGRDHVDDQHPLLRRIGPVLDPVGGRARASTRPWQTQSARSR